MVFYGSKNNKKVVVEGANAVSLLDASGEPQAGSIFVSEEMAAWKPNGYRSSSDSSLEKDAEKSSEPTAQPKKKKSYAARAAGVLYTGTFGRLYRKPKANPNFSVQA